MKYLRLSIIIMIIAVNQATAQSITHATIGSSSGRLYGSNIMVNYTIGESFVTTQSAGKLKLGTGFWTVVPTTYIPLATIIYRFIGNGHFTLASNWEGGVVPPNPLPAGSEIIIAPNAPNAQCILNSPFQVSPGGKFSVIAGKKFIIPGVLNLQ